MGNTVKTIELIGSSTDSWEDADQDEIDDEDETME
jgi:flavin-binding protein dodecin